MDGNHVKNITMLISGQKKRIMQPCPQPVLRNHKRKILNKHLEEVEFYCILCTEAASKFDKESIDFIYIDAGYDYGGVVKEDLEHYWTILKPGGIMAGHDYNTNSEVPDQDWGLCGDGTRNELTVKGAVKNFILPKGLTISVTSYWRQDL